MANELLPYFKDFGKRQPFCTDIKVCSIDVFLILCGRVIDKKQNNSHPRDIVRARDPPTLIFCK